MNEPAMRPPSANRRWPMTREAWSALADELGELRADVAVLSGKPAPEDGIVHLPAFKAARRLELLSSVFHASEKVHDPDRAVIGRRVTLLEEDGDSTTYALVFPGDGDPGQGWISADSPLGTAVMGCGPGERVEVIAPAGRWLVTVLAVE